MERFITQQTAKRRLTIVCEFARGMQAIRDDRVKAKQELIIVNRQLFPFGYRIEVHCYEKDLYLPLKSRSLEPLTQAYEPMSSTTSLSWCCRRIFTELGVSVRPRKPEELSSDFYKLRREYMRPRYIGPFHNTDLDALVNRGQTR